MAQWLAQGTHNSLVGGSNPPGPIDPTADAKTHGGFLYLQAENGETTFVQDSDRLSALHQGHNGLITVVRHLYLAKL